MIARAIARPYGVLRRGALLRYPEERYVRCVGCWPRYLCRAWRGWPSSRSAAPSVVGREVVARGLRCE